MGKGREGDNYRLTPRETFREEDRAPDGIYEVTLPKSEAFGAGARALWRRHGAGA